MSCMQATPAEVAALIEQVKAIDVDLVNELYHATTDAAAIVPGSDGALEPPSKVTVLSASSAAEVLSWSNAGLAAVAAGKVGVLILAGGQGTRLGFDKYGQRRLFSYRLRRTHLALTGPRVNITLACHRKSRCFSCRCGVVSCQRSSNRDKHPSNCSPHSFQVERVQRVRQLAAAHVGVSVESVSLVSEAFAFHVLTSSVHACQGHMCSPSTS